jgi:hypothetical protein
MSESRSEVVKDSNKKAVKAGLVAAGSVTLAIAGAPILAAVAAVPAAVLGWRWWKHRTENGIRF